MAARRGRLAQTQTQRRRHRHRGADTDTEAQIQTQTEIQRYSLTDIYPVYMSLNLRKVSVSFS